MKVCLERIYSYLFEIDDSVLGARMSNSFETEPINSRGKYHSPNCLIMETMLLLLMFSWRTSQLIVMLHELGNMCFFKHLSNM